MKDPLLTALSQVLEAAARDLGRKRKVFDEARTQFERAKEAYAEALADYEAAMNAAQGG